MPFFICQKVQISPKISPQIPNFGNFIKCHHKWIFSLQRQVFVISSVFCQNVKRNPFEPTYSWFVQFVFVTISGITFRQGQCIKDIHEYFTSFEYVLMLYFYVMGDYISTGNDFLIKWYLRDYNSCWSWNFVCRQSMLGEWCPYPIFGLGQSCTEDLSYEATLHVYCSFAAGLPQQQHCSFVVFIKSSSAVFFLAYKQRQYELFTNESIVRWNGTFWHLVDSFSMVHVHASRNLLCTDSSWQNKPLCVKCRCS